MARLLQRIPTLRKPMDMSALRAHCHERVQAGEAAQLVDPLLELIEALSERVQRLEQQVAHLQKAQYGRRSERLSSAQLHLSLGQAPPPLLPEPLPELPTEPEPLPASGPRPPKAPRKKPRHLPEHLPRVVTLSEPSAEHKVCTDCGADKHLIGSEPSEVLEWEPGGFRVEVTERRKYACRSCQSGVVIGPGPQRVLEQAMPGAGLIAEVIVRKIKDHCPLERQGRIFTERFGVPLSASTLGEWMAGGADLLTPVARRRREHALSREHLSTDDTPVRVLDPAHPEGVKRGHLWSFVSDGPEVAFEYTPDWSGAPICKLLADYGHTLQSDGYAGLDALYQKESAPVRAGCLAHARRKFVAALEAGDLRAAFPLHLIQQIYVLERQATQEGCDAAERLRRRQQHAAPRMQELRRQAEALGAQAPPKTPLGRAITYLLRQWEPLTVFLRDGAQRIDNNHTERTLRPVAVGRKNWLFAGSDEGARRLAVLYTVVASCEAAGLRDPWQYVRDVLVRLSRGWPQARLDELLPRNWQAADRGT